MSMLECLLSDNGCLNVGDAKRMWKQADCKKIDDDDDDEVMKLEGRYGTNMVKLTISIGYPRLNVDVFGIQIHARIYMVF